MRFGTNQNLNKEKLPTQPLRLTGGGNETSQRNYYKKGSLVGAFGSNGDNGNNKSNASGKKKDDHSLFYFATTLILGFLALEVVISRNGVRLHAKFN